MIREPALQHISEETLEQYSMGRLSKLEIEPVEDHLIVCHLCQDQLSESEDFLRVVRTATQQLDSHSQLEPWWKKGWEGIWTLPKPVFATAFCALALLVFIPDGTPATAVVDLQTMRGPETAPVALSNATLTLRLPLSAKESLSQLELRVVDTAGKLIKSAPVNRTGRQGVAQVAGLKTGLYWARLYSGEELIREFGLKVR